MNNLNITRAIYSSFKDEISKKIFTAQLNFRVTGDISYIQNLSMRYRNLSADIEAFANKLCNPGNNRLVAFGAGANGKDLVYNFNNLPWVGFIDNYRQDKYDDRTKLPIFSLKQYEEQYGLARTKYVITVYKRKTVETIREQLLEHGITDDDIITIPDWRNNCSQYFDVFVPNPNESFVDCGCYDGSTVFRFAGWCAGGGMTYDKIWSFEPDPSSFVKCKTILNTLKNCELYPYGISDHCGKVHFMANGYENARIVNKTDEKEMVQTIEVVKLDDILKDERVSFIKMDIEGAELNALKGAEQIIKEQKPRLAISVYHNATDFIEIPQLLLSFRSDYKFYLRHYSLLANEIVLYAE
mgnify:CR=1 FL=1